MIHRASGSSPYLSLKPICSSLSLNFLCSPSCLSWPLLYFKHSSAFFFFFCRWNFAFLLAGELYPQSVSSVTQSCMTLCSPMDCSTPGLPVHHQPPELTQTHVHWVGNAIQPSHPLLSPSPACNLSQLQGLFKWVDSSHQVAKVLEFQLKHQSFNEYSELISFRMNWLDLLAVKETLKNLI